MGKVFYTGENKSRPGVYYRIDRTDEANTASLQGVCGCVFKADYGPLNEVVEVTKDNYAQIFGTALTADVMKYLFLGGASSVLACRIGSGGEKSFVELGEAGKITSKYVGEKIFSVSEQKKLGDNSVKEIIIYDGTRIIEKYEIKEGGDEASALETAMAYSKNFSFEKNAEAETKAIVVTEKQVEFTAGKNPDVTVESYSAGFEALESRRMNVIVVDTEDQEATEEGGNTTSITNAAIHELLKAFLQTLANNARFTMGVVTEKTSSTVGYEEKMEHAVEFNDPYLVYILNPKLRVNGEIIDGYQTAALAAGLVSSYPCRYSMTHKVLDAASEILEIVPNTILNEATSNGCIALTLSSNKKVWLDCGINTLVNPPSNMDDGWKTIRRVKTRAELMERILNAVEVLIGNLDNDNNGRATVVTIAQGIIDDMVAEGSLTAGTAYESSEGKSDGNIAYFGLDVIDKESAEKVYFTFRFQFSTNQTI